MSTGSIFGGLSRGGSRWELPILGVLAVLTFALIPVSINHIYGGLPAHPLFLHVPVILIPLAAIGGLVLAVVPRWYSGSAGPWVGLAAVVALGSLNLTMSAGNQLRADLHLQGGGPGAAGVISRHASAAGQLRVLTIAFTAVFLVALAVHATSDGPGSGLAVADRIFAGIRSLPGATIALRLLTALLALACLYWVYHVGDLGAKAVWLSRLQAVSGG